MASVKVIVDVFPHGGYWAAGRFWPSGKTEALLEDDAAGSVEQKLVQLRHATGGELLPMVDQGVETIGQRRSPQLLSLTILPDAVAAPPQIEPSNESTEEA